MLRPRARSGPAQPGAEQAAPPVPAQDGFLGETLAGLGAPGETGLWLRTGLVGENQRGRIVTETGRSLTLELRASGAAPGAGSQISLMAMQSLGLTLGQLATLRVYVD
ncbi:MAG: D-galactarate dehydratase [Pararhodobacter sp.]|nr:D-galactarate dehydratase [Pararhodobacter sp.]